MSLFPLFSKVLKKAVHSRVSQTPACKLHTGHRTVWCRKRVSTEGAALRPTDSVFKSFNQKCVLEEFFVI